MTKFTLEVATKLLARLATEDKYRKLFEKEKGELKNQARKALEEVGHKTPEHDHGDPKRDPVVALEEMKGGLASKEVIKANTAKWLATYAADVDPSLRAFGSFDLCANQ